MLKSLLKPVEPYENDTSMESNRGRHHGEDVDDDLLEGIEKIEVDGIEASLSVGAASEQEGVDVVDIAPTAGIYENGRKYGGPYDPEVWQGVSSLVIQISRRETDSEL